MCRHDGDELMMFPKAGVKDSLKTALRLTKTHKRPYKLLSSPNFVDAPQE